jgi:hypothetical protein
LGTESAGDFLAQLHHACVGFGLVVGEGHIRIVQEAQDIGPALMQAQEEVMADAGGACRGGFQTRPYNRQRRDDACP